MNEHEVQSNTGEQYISKRKNGKYDATINLNGRRYGKCFDSLNEAIAFREGVLCAL